MSECFGKGFCIVSGKRRTDVEIILSLLLFNGYILAASILECHHHIENWDQGHREVYAVPLLFHGAEFLFLISVCSRWIVDEAVVFEVD